MSLTVINRHARSGGIYIGRGTPLGNPYPITRTTSRTRAIELFRDHALFELKHNPEGEFAIALRDIKDRSDRGQDVLLACSCKPKACHGDILVELIEDGHV